MGSGRDKRKKAKGIKPGQGAAKTERKTLKNADKAHRRAERAAQGGEDDIDALLASFALQDAGSVQVQADVPPPSARTFASWVPGLAQDSHTLYLYGGEWFDGARDKMYVYGDLYMYRTDKGSWSRVLTTKGPQPRSSHQAVMHQGHMYVFGGEFTSPNQEKFKTYGDLWRLDLSTWQWEQLPGRGGPSARCGHRMIVYKDRIFLFGGMYDAGSEQRFYNDLWEFVIPDLKWNALGRPTDTRPSPRGGCQLALHGGTLFVVGGYTASLGGEDTGKAHSDVWAWDIAAATWTRVKKAGVAPSPRSSFGMVVHKGRAVVFGGVADQQGKGDKMYSEMFNELYQFNMETRRWFPVVVRAPKGAKANAGSGAADGGATNGDGAVGTDGPAAAESKSAAAPADAPPAAPEFLSALQQHANDPRSVFFQAAQRIQANFRGFVVRKIESTDVPLDDLWSLDIGKLDGWRCIKENSGGEDAFRELEESSDDGSEEEP